MDNISRKRKIEDSYEIREINVKKFHLTRSPSFGKRITLYSKGEESTSREVESLGYIEEKKIIKYAGGTSNNREFENIFFDKSSYKRIMSYHTEESIAEDIQKHKFYDLLPNETKNFHKYMYNVREYLHAC